MRSDNLTVVSVLTYKDTPQTSRGKPGSLPHNPPDLQRQPLVDMDFAVSCPLIQLTLPRI